MAKVKIKSQMTFERHEKKFLISKLLFPLFEAELLEYMQLDSYGKHTISNIYYDTDDFSVIRQSLDKPAYKEKLRLRSYKTPGKDESVFLELKKKYNKITYKRRVSLPLKTAESYLAQAANSKSFGSFLPNDYTGQENTFKEIDWYVTTHAISPSVYIAYDRLAYFCPSNISHSDSSLRLTVDSKIRWRTENLELSEGDSGCNVLDSMNYVIEIKSGSALPVWLCDLLSQYEIYPQSFSKYGRIYQNHLLYSGQSAEKTIPTKEMNRSDVAC